MTANASSVRVGLLPLYVALYDESVPFLRPIVENYYAEAADALSKKGLDVMRVPVCRLKDEFADAIRAFETAGVDCIISLHLAYSPSLESAEVVAATKLPLIVLDSTEAFRFSHPDEILANHGIHGVMDFCNLLRRYKKDYAIAAGHLSEEGLLDRVVELAKSAVAAGALKGMRVASIGGSFAGMGDFVVSDEELAEFGIQVVRPAEGALAACRAAVTDAEIEAEMAADLAEGVRLPGDYGNFSPEIHARSTRDSLALRRWLNEEKIDAFSVNFPMVDKTGLRTMPFMETCRAMARGLGYAGEGDILTAAFCGALRRGFTSTTFVEPFCPDWSDNRVLLSHMGEVNYGCTDGPIELTEFEFVYGTAENPVVGFAHMRAGEAVYINIYNDGDGFNMLLSPVTMEHPAGEDAFAGKIRGWMRPKMPLGRFLEGLSAVGATHHSILVYDTTVDALAYFGRLCGLKTSIL